jgi:hypothetical protein
MQMQRTDKQYMCSLQAYKRWKGIELKLTDAASEANDNVRYLTTLERSFEVRELVVVLRAELCIVDAVTPKSTPCMPPGINKPLLRGLLYC